jgi:histidinol-phosphate/aromatic aminotransferase/cobyric acid decarboxylase-like protein
VARLSGRPLADILDVSANLHPWGPPPGVRAAVARAIDAIDRYPPPYAEPLAEALADVLGRPVSVGNGATELLLAAFRGARRVWVQPPCYGGYAEAAAAAGVPVVAGDGPYEAGDVVVVGRPNNPDGRLMGLDEVARLARGVDRLVVDESFLPFLDEPSAIGLAPNVVVVQSMTKTYAIPGLRLGWAWNLPEGALPPWSVNALALAAGLACVEAWDWPRRPPIDTWRSELEASLARLPGVVGVDGAAIFLRMTLARPVAATVRAAALERYGVLVRDASTMPGCDARHVRVAVRAPEDNARVIAALASALGASGHP